MRTDPSDDLGRGNIYVVASEAPISPMSPILGKPTNFRHAFGWHHASQRIRPSNQLLIRTNMREIPLWVSYGWTFSAQT